MEAVLIAILILFFLVTVYIIMIDKNISELQRKMRAMTFQMDELDRRIQSVTEELIRRQK